MSFMFDLVWCPTVKGDRVRCVRDSPQPGVHRGPVSVSLHVKIGWRTKPGPSPTLSRRVEAARMTA